MTRGGGIAAVLPLAILLSGPVACGEDRAEREDGAASLATSPPKLAEDRFATPRRDVQTASDRACIDRFHFLAVPSVFENRWMGIPTQQSPTDVWITQEIMFEVKPDVLIETGTLHGGSAALWATLLAQINPESRVITIDIEDQAGEARELPIVEERVEFLVGSSVDPVIVETVREKVAGKRVMVILDSNHERSHVLAELEAYAPLVPVGGYVVVQDSAANGHPVMPQHGPGPYEAIEEFLAKDDRFVADRGRERMLFTLHPMGYLKRIR